MKAISYPVKHRYQTTNTACSPTALSVLLSAYGKDYNPLEIEADVPQSIDDTGHKLGTINQQLATWCTGLGFKVTLYTFDCQVIGQSWAGLEPKDLLEQLKRRGTGWVVPSLGEVWTKQYADAYVDFISSGGTLAIRPYVTAKLLYTLLENGPYLPSVSYNTLYGAARVQTDDDNKLINDDIHGRSSTHSIVVYGNDKDGNLLIADPWEKPGLHTLEPDRLVAAISAAQTECDNLLFQILPS